MNKLNELESQLTGWLDIPPSAPERDSRDAVRGKARFMTMVDTELDKRSTRHASIKPLLYWQGNAVKALVSIAVVVGLLSGGYATVHAAQDDLPDQALYPLKLAVENVRLELHPDPQVRFDLLMEMTQTRLDEVAALEKEGKSIPPSAIQRFDRQNRQALQAAAGMDDTHMHAALLQYRARLETQAMTINMLQAHAPSDPALTQIQTMLTIWLGQVDAGLSDPQQFRQTIREENGNRPAPTLTPIVPTETHENTLTPNSQGNSTPQVTPTPNSGPEITPSGSGNGSGTPMPIRTATPKPNEDKPSGTHKPKPGGMRPAGP